jgi:hypothetical protein
MIFPTRFEQLLEAAKNAFLLFCVGIIPTPAAEVVLVFWEVEDSSEITTIRVFPGSPRRACVVNLFLLLYYMYILPIHAHFGPKQVVVREVDAL